METSDPKYHSLLQETRSINIPRTEQKHRIQNNWIYKTFQFESILFLVLLYTATVWDLTRRLRLVFDIYEAFTVTRAWTRTFYHLCDIKQESSSLTIHESYCILLPKHLSEWDIKVRSKCEFEVNCASPRFPMVMLLFHNYQCDITAANLDNNNRN